MLREMKLHAGAETRRLFQVFGVGWSERSPTLPGWGIPDASFRLRSCRRERSQPVPVGGLGTLRIWYHLSQAALQSARRFTRECCRSEARSSTCLPEGQ